MIAIILNRLLNMGLLLGIILLATCLLVLYSLLEIVWKTHRIEGHAVGAWAVGAILLLSGMLLYRSGESKMPGSESAAPQSIWVNWDSFLLLFLGVVAIVIGFLLNHRYVDSRIETQEDLLERLREDSKEPPGNSGKNS